MLARALLSTFIVSPSPCEVRNERSIRPKGGQKSTVSGPVRLIFQTADAPRVWMSKLSSVGLQTSWPPDRRFASSTIHVENL